MTGAFASRAASRDATTVDDEVTFYYISMDDFDRDLRSPGWRIRVFEHIQRATS